MAMVLGIKPNFQAVNLDGLIFLKINLYKMNKIILILILITQNIFSQNIKVTFLEENTNKPISNVMLYENENLIGTSDAFGVISINISNKTKHAIVVKEEFEDVLIELKNNEKYYLKKIKSIEIEGVLVKNKNVTDILNELLPTLTSITSLYNFTDNTHFYNIFKTNNDTLLYFNNRLFKGENSTLTDYQNKIIKKFTVQNNRQLYVLNKKPILFFNDFTLGNSPHNNFNIQIVCKFQKLFTYELNKSDDEKYIINFKPSKKNKEYPFVGRIIIDKDDLGIYEFSYTSAVSNKSIRNVPFQDRILNYQILNEKCLILYTKNEEKRYDLVTFNYNIKFKSLDKSFKNEIFENKCIKEPTNAVNNNKNLKKINFTTFEIN